MEFFFWIGSWIIIHSFKQRILKKKEIWIDFLFVLLTFLQCLFVSKTTWWFSQAFLTFLYALFLKDFYTYYLSWKWCIPSFALILLWMFVLDKPLSLWGALLYGIPSTGIHLWHKDWIGISDVFYLYYFGAMLGIERMMVACFTAVLTAIIFSFISKKKMVPFLSFLSIGILISYWKGYTIWTMIQTFFYR